MKDTKDEIADYEVPMVYCKAITAYGIKAQSIVAIEELSELTKEITKQLRGIGDKSHLIEEIADVEIMLNQVKLMYDIYEGDVEEYKNRKIERLKAHLEERDEEPGM